RDGQAEDVTEELADSGVGGVADALEVSHQGGQARAEQAAALYRQGQAAVVSLVAVGAVGLVDSVLLDVQGGLGDVDLLDDAGAKAGGADPVAAAGAAGVRAVVEGLIDHRGWEERSLVPGMARLPPSGAACRLRAGGLGRPDDVTGRRLGGGRRVLAGGCQLLLQPRHRRLQSLDLAAQPGQLLLQSLTSRTGGGCLFFHTLVLWLRYLLVCPGA